MKPKNPIPAPDVEEIISGIVGAFETFMVELIKSGGVVLSEQTRFLPLKDLYRLNDQFFFKSPHVTNQSRQTSYPLIHLLYHLALDGKFASFQGRKGNVYLVPNEALYNEFCKLPLPARYLFLLETFWTCMDFRKVAEIGFPGVYFSEMFSFVRKFKPGKEIFVRSSPFSGSNPRVDKLFIPFLMAYFLWFFGFYEMDLPESAPKVDKNTFPGRSIQLTSFGNTLCKILSDDRPIASWNKNVRSPYYDPRTENKKQIPPFSKAFLPLFDRMDLKKELAVPETELKPGVYQLQVSLRKDCYRVFEIPAKSTFVKLHDAIQTAFDFDDDHLYGFYLETRGNRGDYEISGSPFELDQADEITLGNQILFVGQSFRYIFDFGHHWEFSIKVLDYFPDKELEEVKLIKQVGDSPEQYPNWDEEDEW